MPLFLFDTDDGYSCVRDEEGCEVSDLQAARELALKAVLEIASARLSSDEHRPCTILVRDAAGRRVYRAKVEMDGEWIRDASGEV